MTSSKVASDDAWGSEDDYFSRPPTKVNGDASWIATIGFWMLLFLNLIQRILARGPHQLDDICDGLTCRESLRVCAAAPHSRER